ncbi:unnamed protein product, partial [Schistocephalus solidus]|uniref:Transmembrane protein n=1 Tax=Schistocephalus solidus TaxID=70667 RepID=A0A183S9K2_SCHSO
IVIRLSDISSFETHEQEDVRITAYDKQSVTSTLSKSTLASSYTTSQQSLSIGAPDEADSDRALDSRESRWSPVSASGLSASTHSRQRMHSMQLQVRPVPSSSPNCDVVVSASSSSQSSPDGHVPSQDERLRQPQRPPPAHSILSTVERTFVWGLSVLSDVAFQASCLPLSLLCRLITGGMSTSFSLSPRSVVPSRSFTIFIAYVVLTFLAISMAYLYYRIETFPMDASLLLSSTGRRAGHNLRTPVSAMCGQEFKEVASTLAQLSDLSDRVKQLTESIKAISVAGSAFEAQEGRA